MRAVFDFGVSRLIRLMDESLLKVFKISSSSDFSFVSHLSALTEVTGVMFIGLSSKSFSN